MITIIDNFLSASDFNDLISTVGDRTWSKWENISFNYVPYVATKADVHNPGYFVHLLYENLGPEPIRGELTSLSEYSWIADRLLKRYMQLDTAIVDNKTMIHHAKVNLFPSSQKRTSFGFHQDIPIIPHNSLIFYLNDCDGYTLFDDGSRVATKANRAVIITDGLAYEHASTNATDSARCNINVVLK